MPFIVLLVALGAALGVGLVVYGIVGRDARTTPPANRAASTSPKTIAVSDHLLLGGDNIDLAIAHMVEPRLATGGGGLSAGQWDHLVARCRSNHPAHNIVL